MKRKILLFAILLFIGTVSKAQPRGHFDPERFQVDLERHVVGAAQLTEAECAKFLPLYRQMRKQQIALMQQRRQLRNSRNAAEVIRTQDQIDIRLKKLQQQYHERFLKVLPAEKVLKIIKAEDAFHRKAFKNAHPHDK